jgi:hypothetical protein
VNFFAGLRKEAVMDALKTRFGSAFEWIVAAAFLLATLAVGSLIVREVRAVPEAAPVRADDASPAAVPAGVPLRAISVPMLLLLDGKEVRIGDSMAAVASLLGRAGETGVEHVDRGQLGERLTRFYEHAGTKFILVFERLERTADARVVAIYLQ